MASSAREYRVLGRVQVAIGFIFAISAAILNPIEAVVGVFLMTPLLGAGLYFGALRRGARRTLAAAEPAPTHEREEPGDIGRRIAWPVAAEVAVLLLFAAIGHAPGLMAGIGFGAGLALLRTARYVEHWEVGHGAVLLRQPGTRRYYVAGPE